ncbi:MAG: ROK family protein [Capsulimonadaceae bacterium]|nr:ROK family protein [Capsulimonadaceae bacterium]
MKIFVGLDIGGTKLLVCAANEKGEVLRRTSRGTPLPLQEGLDALYEMVAEVAAGDEILAFGAAAGGPLDWKNGIVSPLHQPEWQDVPLGRLFKERYDCPLAVEVDTDAAVLAEYQFGGARVSRLLYITMSTGVGGGLLLDGELYRGQGGSHPEVGHLGIAYRCAHAERIECECGAGDCVEAIISGNGIRRIYGKPAQNLDEAEWSEVSYNLGQALRSYSALYAPDLIVLGGGVAVGGGQRLLEPAIRLMQEHCKLVPAPEVRLSDLGYETALYGSVALAMRAKAE